MSVQRSRALYVLVALTAGCARSFTGPPEPHPDGAEPFCSEGGFCWVTPRPQGNALLAVDVSETGDAVAVGRGGAALLLDERGISELDLDTHDDLVGAWVAPDGAVWAAPQIGWGSDGGELVYFREGLSIRVPAPGTGAIAGLDGVSATDVLFGQDGVLYRGGPEGFRPYFAPAEPELRVVDVVVRSADDVWVLMATPAIPDGPVGDAVAFHLRGPDADVVARVERAEREVTGLTATGDGTLVAYGHGVFAVSDAGFVDLGLDDVGTVHAAAGADLEHLWLLTATGTYLGGRRQGDNDLFLALASREDGTQIVRVGDRGAMGALVDDAWIDIAVGTPAVPAPLDPDAFGTVPPAIWVGEARAAWAASPTDAWRVRDDRRYFAPFDAVLEHWDGARWTSVRDAGWSCTRIHGSAADDVWVAGGTRYLDQLDGAGWRTHQVLEAGAIRGVWSGGPRAVWAVGVDTSAGGALAVWRGAIRRWSGDAWETVLLAEDVDFTAVAGRAADDVYVLGRRTSSGAGVLLRVRGDAIEEIPVPGEGAHWGGLEIDGASVRLVRDGDVLEREGDGWTVSPHDLRPWDARCVELWSGPSGTWIHDGATAMRRR